MFLVQFAKGDTSKGRSTPKAEEELANHIIDMETSFFGLTTKDLRKIVYEIAERGNNLIEKIG